jgi:RNA polymerase sigma-70 factor (ECF subfamily)
MNFNFQGALLNSANKDQPTFRDEHLVLAAQGGSSDAFAELERLYSGKLYRTIFGITKNREDAEDAVQDTFMRAYRSLCNFEGRSSFYSWLTRIAINSALMTLRRRPCPEIPFAPLYETGEDFSYHEVKDSSPNPEQIYDQRQRCLSVLRAIKDLEPNLRGAVQIRLMHGCSLKEIAQSLDVSVAAVKARLHRARVRLKAA